MGLGSAVGAVTGRADPATPAGRQFPLRRVLRSVLIATALVLLAVALAREGRGLLAALRRLDGWLVAAAGLAVLAALMASMLSWHAVLAGLGSRLPLPAAGRLYFLAQLGKYVPGSVWPVVAQVELGREYQVPAARSVAAAGLNMILNLVIGVLVGLAGLGLADPAGFDQHWWLLFLVPPSLVLLHPAVMQRFTNLALRLLRRPTIQTWPGAAALLRASGWSVAMWIAFGVYIALLAHGTGAQGRWLVVLCTGAYALAWVTGFVVIFAPAGAGPREIVLVVTLAQVLPQSAALAVALVSRVLGMVGDLVVMLLGLAAEKWHRRHSPTALSIDDIEQTPTG